jgi:hypothetical protein
MATGYEVRMYHDINSIAESLERIAKALDKLTTYNTGIGSLSSEVRDLRQDLTEAIDRIDLDIHA